jgi:anti-sigma factor RsiW
MRRSDRALSCRRVEVLLDAHVDGDLRADVAARVDAHLSSCDACQESLAQARRLRDTLRALPQQKSAVTSPEALRERLAAEQSWVSEPRVSQPGVPQPVASQPAVLASTATGATATPPSRRVVPLWRTLAVAAVLAGLVFGAARILHRPVVDQQVTAADVARAELQVRWVMARLGTINRRTAERVREEVIQKGVVEPSARAVESALGEGSPQ